MENFRYGYIKSPPPPPRPRISTQNCSWRTWAFCVDCIYGYITPIPQNQYSELLMENLGILCTLQIWLNHPHPPESVLRTSSVDFRYGCIKPPFHPHPFQYNNLEPLMENLKDILCEHYDMATTPLPPNWNFSWMT